MDRFIHRRFDCGYERKKFRLVDQMKIEFRQRKVLDQVSVGAPKLQRYRVFGVLASHQQRKKVVDDLLVHHWVVQQEWRPRV